MRDTEIEPFRQRMRAVWLPVRIDANRHEMGLSSDLPSQHPPQGSPGPHGNGSTFAVPVDRMVMSPLFEGEYGQICGTRFYQITSIQNTAKDGMLMMRSGHTKNKMRQHDAESIALRV